MTDPTKDLELVAKFADDIRLMVKDVLAVGDFTSATVSIILAETETKCYKLWVHSRDTIRAVASIRSRAITIARATARNRRNGHRPRQPKMVEVAT